MADDSAEYDEGVSRAFSDRLSAEYASLQNDWDCIRRDLKLGAISRGIWSGASVVVAGTLHWAIGAAGVVGSLAAAVREYRELSSRRDLAKSKPLSIFIELARRK